MSTLGYCLRFTTITDVDYIKDLNWEAGQSTQNISCTNEIELDLGIYSKSKSV